MRLTCLAPALAAGIAAITLAACTPADAALDGDLVVNGLEPAFWAVTVSREENKSAISIMGEPDFQGTAPVKASSGEGEFTLTSATPQGPFIMRVRQEACLDGIDNNAKYDWSVSVDWNGETLTGCARPSGRK